MKTNFKVGDEVKRKENHYSNVLSNKILIISEIKK